MQREWKNEAGYTVRLFVDDALVSLLTLESPNGHLEVLRRYEYGQRHRAYSHAELLAKAMSAREVAPSV